MTVDELIAFEKDIAAEYDAAKIRAPIHLDGGNEHQLIDVFKGVHAEDWVCGSWRMHYKCLLHGVPPDVLKAKIMAGSSITLCFPEYRIVSSAIVGGILPIALGIAWSIKRVGGTNRVWCFLGDMTAIGGMFFECVAYAIGNDLPIWFVVEDNNKSVCTPTNAVFSSADMKLSAGKVWPSGGVTQIRYELTWPHAGAGKRIQF